MRWPGSTRSMTARKIRTHPAALLDSCRGVRAPTHDAEKCSRRFGLEKLKGGRQGFLHIPAPARMLDPQRALWRRFMRSEHGRREGCATGLPEPERPVTVTFGLLSSPP